MRSLVRRSRRATEFLQTLRFRLEHRASAPPIVVHQMARVGSISVLHAVLGCFERGRVFHTHYLNPATIAGERARVELLHRTRGDVGLSRELLAATMLAERWRREGGRRGDGEDTARKWRVVTLVRDPVARTISAFFRHFAYNHPQLPATFHEDPRNVGQLLELFLAPDEEERRVTRQWFDRELREPLDFDVFASPFPRETGFSRWTTDRAELLLIRTEDLDRVGERALRDFLGAPALVLRTRNRGVEQSYGGAYTEFMRRLRLPSIYLDEMYDAPLARHFYGEEERGRLRRGWGGA